MEEKEKNINFKFRKESDVPKYIEMVQEQQKELFKFCIKLMKSLIPQLCWGEWSKQERVRYQ